MPQRLRFRWLRHLNSRSSRCTLLLYLLPLGNPPFIICSIPFLPQLRSCPFLLPSLPSVFLPLFFTAITGLFLSLQRWAVAPDSVTLKCIPRKILPFCERVIFREKRRKGLVRQPGTATIKSQRGSSRQEPTSGKKNKFNNLIKKNHAKLCNKPFRNKRRQRDRTKSNEFPERQNR